MWQRVKRFKNISYQTQLFIFMGLIYFVALIWTTTQVYLRLACNRSELVAPIMINISPADSK